MEVPSVGSSIEVGSHVVTLDEYLEHGAFWHMWRGTSNRFGQVTMKLAKPDNADRWHYVKNERETMLRLMGAPPHASVLSTIAVKPVHQDCIFLEPHVNNRASSTEIESVLPSINVCRSWVVQIVNALGHLHTHGIIHRDVHPDNVFIADGGQHAMLTGFDYATPMADDARSIIGT